MDQKGEWLSDALRATFHFRKWNGVKFEGLHEAKGYMSQIMRAYPDWEGEQLPESFIIKIPTYSTTAEKAIDIPIDNENDNECQKTILLIKIFHRTESKIYELFEQLESPPVPTPRVYFNRNSSGTWNDEFSVLVMEDLGKYSTVDIVVGFNDMQMYAIVDAIVDLHVYSFTHNGWESVGFSLQELKETESIATILGALADRLKQRSPYHFGKIDMLMELLGKDDWSERYLISCHSGEILCALAHGDLWSENIMWEGNTLRAIIDWQLAHCGSITEDIMRVLSTCVSVTSRKRLTKPLLSYYYTKLKNKMADCGKTLPFTFADVEDSYRSTLLYTAAMTIFAAAVWSNSAVLKDGSANETQRINEIFDRTKSIIEEAVEATSIS
uniref:CHK kinase-like domain-containing protein n=2 Tax=Parascaris univalens TaxID=6257 RepID=A0A915CDY8_PARUN